MRRFVLLVGLVCSAIARGQTGRGPIPTDTIRSWIHRYQPGVLTDDTSNVVVFFVGPHGRVTRSTAGRDYRQRYVEAQAELMHQLYRTRGNPVVAGPDTLLPIEVPFESTGRRGLLDTMTVPATVTGMAITKGIPEWPHGVLIIFVKPRDPSGR